MQGTSITRFMNQDFELYKLETVIEYGRNKESYTLYDTYKGRFDTETVFKQVVGDKKTFTITDTLYCNIIDVEYGDKIKKVADGSEYKIVSIINPMDFYNHLEVGLERIV